MIKFFAMVLLFTAVLIVGFYQFGDTLHCGMDSASCGEEWGQPTIELGHDPMEGILGRQRLSEVIDERANK